MILDQIQGARPFDPSRHQGVAFDPRKLFSSGCHGHEQGSPALRGFRVPDREAPLQPCDRFQIGPADARPEHHFAGHWRNLYPGRKWHGGEAGMPDEDRLAIAPWRLPHGVRVGGLIRDQGADVQEKITLPVSAQKDSMPEPPIGQGHCEAVSGPDARSVAEGPGLDIEPGRCVGLVDIPIMIAIVIAVRYRERLDSDDSRCAV